MNKKRKIKFFENNDSFQPRENCSQCGGRGLVRVTCSRCYGLREYYDKFSKSFKKCEECPSSSWEIPCYCVAEQNKEKFNEFMK